MADPVPPRPWLSIVGIGEDGLDGLTSGARAALDEADIVFGGDRHLKLGKVEARGSAWPIPFSTEPLLALRGKRVAALVSGDPFWFGAGSSLAKQLAREEWRAFPAPSCFSLAASRLGWPLEEATCLGLHAAPFETLRPHLQPGSRLLCLVADAAAPARLAAYLSDTGFGDSRVIVLEALGGPHERIRTARADAFAIEDIAVPVMVAFQAEGGPALPRTPGLPDALFTHDGQITKSPIRALTIAALAPCIGERLWDIGAGSGSISVEWCLAGGVAIAIETRADRAGNIRANAARFGLAHRLGVVEGRAPEALAGLALPDAIFIGGGADAALLEIALAALRPGGRLVANAVTLETETLLMRAFAENGGSLLRLDLATAQPLGGMQGWQPSRPLLQW
ncbi:MAG: precorrin-6Y C5 15-methyltransferase / precorrin-8W, partial [Beijerinckiaceae bacterium]